MYILSTWAGLLSSTEQEKDPKFWNTWAQQTLKNALSLQTLNQNKAQNLIFFLGDGESSVPQGQFAVMSAVIFLCHLRHLMKVRLQD